MARTPVLKLTKVIHYGEADKGFMSDHYSIDLKAGKDVIAQFGDQYHDRGAERAESFVHGIEWALQIKVKITEQRIADGQT